MSWAGSLFLGWGAFFLMTAALSTTTVSAAPALAVVLVAIGVTLLVLPRARPGRQSIVELPAWDLPLRALSAVALVLALTAVAGQLGAKLSGLLAPFPVIASVLAVFTHAQYGEQDLLRIMRGFVLGLVAYALFCFVLAVSLEAFGIAESFLLATLTALATQTVALTVTWRRREPVVETLGPAS
jgi:energy-converting hydrogenase Eha subunit A